MAVVAESNTSPAYSNFFFALVIFFLSVVSSATAVDHRVHQNGHCTASPCNLRASWSSIDRVFTHATITTTTANNSYHIDRTLICLLLPSPRALRASHVVRRMAYACPRRAYQHAANSLRVAGVLETLSQDELVFPSPEEGEDGRWQAARGPEQSSSLRW